MPIEMTSFVCFFFFLFKYLEISEILLFKITHVNLLTLSQSFLFIYLFIFRLRLLQGKFGFGQKIQQNDVKLRHCVNQIILRCWKR